MDAIIILTSLSVAFTAALLTIGVSRISGANDAVVERLLAMRQGPIPEAETVRERDVLLGKRRNELFTSMAQDLERAGSQLRVAEYLALRVVVALVFFLVTIFLFKGSIVGIFGGGIAGVVGYIAPRLYFRFRQGKRLAEFERQLPEALTMMSGALKAGVGLLHGMELVADQMSDPISGELRRMLHEASLGAGTETALKALPERIKSRDLDIVITAILIQREVGGNLAEILDNVSNTIRERERIRGEIRTLTTTNRWQGYIAQIVPIGLGGILFLLNPEYMSVLFTDSMGRILLLIAIVWQFIGFLIMRKIVDIEI